MIKVYKEQDYAQDIDTGEIYELPKEGEVILIRITWRTGRG